MGRKEHRIRESEIYRKTLCDVLRPRRVNHAVSYGKKSTRGNVSNSD
jgi:hypothetical protein